MFKKMKKMKFILQVLPFLLIVFCFTSCDNTKKQDLNTSIEIFRCLNCNEKQKPGNPEYDGLKIVKLETTTSCLLYNITQIDISDSIIFIVDGYKYVYAFDMEGRFISQIGEYGQGPGEYLFLTALYIDDKNKNVVIVDGYKNSLIKYDFQGKYLNSEKLADEPEESIQMCRQAKLTNDNKLLLCHMMNGTPVGDNLAYYLMDLKTHSLVGKYFSYDPIKLNNRFQHFSNHPMAISGEDIDFILPLCDTIYSYPSFSPKYIIETPGKMASKKQVKQNTNDYRLDDLYRLHDDGFFTGFLNIFETNSKIVLTCIYDKEGGYFFGDKTTKEGRYYWGHLDHLVKGEVYRKIPFFTIIHAFDNSLIGVATINELSFHKFEFDPEYAEGQQLKYLQSISKNDDNPILFFYELKNE
jgi:hypothetical protein